MILLPVAFPCEAASGLFFYGNNFLDSILGFPFPPSVGQQAEEACGQQGQR